MPKYEVWTGRFDVQSSRYTSFEAENSDEALKEFKKYEDDPALGFDRVTLFPIVKVTEGIEGRGAALKTVRESSGDDALDYVA